MNIFGMGPMEIMLILVLGLIVLGPGRLPEVMGQVGKAVRDFRRATSELSEEFNRTIQAEIDETKAAIEGTNTIAPPPTAAPTAVPAPTPHYTNGTTAAPPPSASIPVAATAVAAEPPTAVPDAGPVEPRAAQQPARPSDDLLPPY